MAEKKCPKCKENLFLVSVDRISIKLLCSNKKCRHEVIIPLNIQEMKMSEKIQCPKCKFRGKESKLVLVNVQHTHTRYRCERCSTVVEVKTKNQQLGTALKIPDIS